MKKNTITKIIPALTLSTVLLTSSIVVYANEPLLSINAVQATNAISIDGIALEGASTTTFDDHVYLPLRAVAEKLGYEVNWLAETKSIALIRGAHYITLSTLEDGYTFAKTAPMKLGFAPVLNEGVTYVPFEFLTDIMQLNAVIEANNSITIVTETTEADNIEQSTIEVVEVTISDDINEILVNDSIKGEVRLNISEATNIKDEAGNTVGIEAIKTGMKLSVEYGEAMTMSLPPLNNPVAITVLGEVTEDSESLNSITSEAVIDEIVAIDEDFEHLIVTTASGEKLALIISAETKLDLPEEHELAVGDNITAEYSTAMTRSIPAQTQCYSLSLTK